SPDPTQTRPFPVQKTEAEWQAMLTGEQFAIARQKGTERAFTGEYYNCETPGRYLCVCCGQPLFDAAQKYDSGSAWPSFWQPAGDAAVATERDTGHGMVRTEIMCSRCGAHLGHVFEDGPQPTGLRYCVNSASLSLKPE